jgi:hypothetical protein
MNPISSVGLGTLTALEAPAAAATTLPATASLAGAAGRDEQMAELGTTASSVNALQSMAMQQPMAPLTLPPTQHTAPPQANTSDELVASMSGGDNDGG